MLSAASRLMVRSSEALLRLSRWRKQLLMVAADGVMLPAALWGALALQSGSGASVELGSSMWLTAAVTAITIPLFAHLGLYRTVIRYVGEEAFLAVVRAVLLSTAVLAALVLLGGFRNISIATSFAYCLFALLLIGGSRLAMRIYFRAVAGMARERVVVYGAGLCGVQLVQALTFSNDYRPMAFIDDDGALQRRVVQGLPVYGPENLGMLIPKLGLSRVFLAMPSISPMRRAEILAGLDVLPIRVKSVPGLSDLVSGAASLKDIREIDIEEMLDRESGPRNENLLDTCVRDRVVMVTGAGGSIGSQLCRRLLRLGAKQLILYEQSEFQLYQIERELSDTLRQHGSSVGVVALLGSVQDRPRLKEVMTHFKVESVFHAAAYKHVPMVEYNIVEGTRNNVLGSWQVARAAASTGVRTCVLISTDKAVRPTSVMGASKRLAELIFQGMAADAAWTRFCIVRLGNVIGSSGSVIPLFRDQIRAGGPLTVTDAKVTRYFMTLSEAAELIIQAGSMALGGEIFVLDMGKPVRIDSLARKMIRLAGFTVRCAEHPKGDVAIEYIGLRAGEKLHEELVIGNNVERTAHPRILCAKEEYLPLEQIRLLLRLLSRLCAQHECDAIRQVFLRAADGYLPSGPLMDRLWLQQFERSCRASIDRPAQPPARTVHRDFIIDAKPPTAARPSAPVVPALALRSVENASEPSGRVPAADGVPNLGNP